MDTDRTLTRTTTLTETLTLTITLTLTLFSHSVIHRQHFTGGRNHWVKRLVRLLDPTYTADISLYTFSGSMDRCQVRVRVRIRRVGQNGTHGNSMVSHSQTLELVDWIIRKLVKLTNIVKLSKFYIGPPI